jgi:hypothetical protein
MRRFVLLAGAALVALASPAAGIIGGDADEGRHPNVAVLDVQLADGRGFLCTGTLVAPDVVLTAAHCVLDAGSATEWIHVSFADDPVHDADLVLQAPFISGQGVPHPGFDPSSLALGSLQHDIGVVLLDDPAAELWPGVTPAALPPARALDGLARGPRVRFDIVGYGLSDVAGPGRPAVDYDTIVRRTAATQLRQLTAEFVFAQAMNPRSARTGIICSGDSGGPLLAGATVVGVTSFHRNLSGAPQLPQTPLSGCEGLSGFPRLDTSSARAFLDDFVPLP